MIPGKKLRPSFYNILVNFKGDEFILFNSLSGALIKIKGQVANRVIKALEGNLSALRKRELKILEDDRFLIPEGTDELIILKARSWVGRMRSEDFSLSILLTLECNFSCSYCFEERRKEIIKPETEEKIYSLISRKANHCDLISVDWYGGEPLLEWDILQRMNTRIYQICQNKGCNYIASMTTNGYLLSKEVIKYFKQYQVKHLQITLDGPPEIHNQMRPTKQGKETFNTIMKNIKHAIDSNISVILRINVLEKNINSVEKLIDILEKEGLKNRIIFLIKSVVSSAANPCEKECLPPKEFSKKSIIQYRKAVERGWAIFPNLDLLRTYEFCIADSINHFLIDPSGLLYKCGECFTQEESVGYLKNNGEPELFFEKWALWIAKDPFAYHNCRKCKLLPICMGGCSMKRFWKKKDWCLDIKYNFDDFIRLICLSQENIERAK
jgi:uncharacterized protein